MAARIHACRRLLPRRQAPGKSGLFPPVGYGVLSNADSRPGTPQRRGQQAPPMTHDGATLRLSMTVAQPLWPACNRATSNRRIEPGPTGRNKHLAVWAFSPQSPLIPLMANCQLECGRVLVLTCNSGYHRPNTETSGQSWDIYVSCGHALQPNATFLPCLRR
jgi:hypothetical protein